MTKQDNDLKNIPGIGKRIEQHLFNIGIYTIDDLKGKDAQELYFKDAIFKGFEDDRCLLYVYRLAVEFANGNRNKNLKWWDFKD